MTTVEKMSYTKNCNKKIGKNTRAHVIFENSGSKYTYDIRYCLSTDETAILPVIFAGTGRAGTQVSTWIK